MLRWDGGWWRRGGGDDDMDLAVEFFGSDMYGIVFCISICSPDLYCIHPTSLLRQEATRNGAQRIALTNCLAAGIYVQKRPVCSHVAWELWCRVCVAIGYRPKGKTLSR